jgi:hypothetical protein
MRAHLKSLHSMELDGPLDSFRPDDPEHFGISIMAFIGSTDDGPADSFDALVCTPSWLAEHFQDPRISRWKFELPGLMFGSRFIFMERWDYPALLSAVSGLCAFHEADDWGMLANRIGRHIPWEFDYQYDKFLDGQATVPRFPPDGSTP